MPTELKTILSSLTKIRGFAAGLVSGAVISAVASFFFLGAPEATVLAALKETSAKCLGYAAGLAPEIVNASVVDEGTVQESPVDGVNAVVGEIAEDGSDGSLDLDQDAPGSME